MLKDCGKRYTENLPKIETAEKHPKTVIASKAKQSRFHISQ